METPSPKPKATPQPLAPAPVPQRRATGGRGRAILIVLAAAMVAALGFAAIATGLVQLPGSGAVAPTPAASVTQNEPQQADEGNHTVAGRFSTVTPDLVEQHKLSRNSGVVIREAFGNGPLDKGGVRANDVIIDVDGVPVRAYGEFTSKIRLTPIGQQMIVTVDRAGVAESHPVTIARCLVRYDAPSINPPCKTWTP
jgi:S1-C subfamily serine protease